MPCRSYLLTLLFIARPTWQQQLTICTTVMNEVDYMLEWIEYYALQGATRLVIGDHLSSDGLRHLPAFYASRRSSPEVVVLPNSGEQTPFLNKCARKYRHSDWLGFLDNDEFAWAPGQPNGSLLGYLSALPKDVTQVHAFDLRFGVGDWVKRPRLRLTQRSATPLDGRYRLVTEEHTRRAPCKSLGEERQFRAAAEEMALFGCNTTAMDEAYAQQRIAIKDGGWARRRAPVGLRIGNGRGDGFCGQFLGEGERLGKSFVRGYAFAWLGHPHYAQLRKGISHRETDLGALVINHYWVRSIRDAHVKARQWKKNEPVEWVEAALPLQHAIEDNRLAKIFAVQLAERIRVLLE